MSPRYRTLLLAAFSISAGGVKPGRRQPASNSSYIGQRGICLLSAALPKLIKGKHLELPEADTPDFSLLAESADFPWDEKRQPLSCGISAFAPGLHQCPASCPFLLQNFSSGCQWYCVAASGCGKLVPDHASQVCRECNVKGCQDCIPGQDKCQTCFDRFSLTPNGTCRGNLDSVWFWIFIVLGALAAGIIIWYIALLLSPAINVEVLNRALQHRTRSCLQDVRHGGGMFSIFTNLHAVPSDGSPPVGGPGLMLMFNLQAAILIWSTLAAAIWGITVAFLGRDAIWLGTYTTYDLRSMCQAIFWGAGIRNHMRSAKLVFTALMYTLSTLGAVYFGCKQQLRFFEADKRSSTMMDYALYLEGFPEEQGTSVESDIQQFLEQATGCQVVGVSVCWDFYSDHQTVYDVLARIARHEEEKLEDLNLWQLWSPGNALLRQPSNRRLSARQTFVGSVMLASEHINVRRAFCCCKPLCQLFAWINGKIVGFCDDDAKFDEEFTSDTACTILSKVKSSGSAVAVFPTEHTRDQAMIALESSRAKYKGTHAINACVQTWEPESLFWENFGFKKRETIKRLVLGVLLTLIVIVLWGCIFYLPFAHYQVTVYNLMGKPGVAAHRFTLSMLICIGNQLVYLVVSIIAHRAGMITRDGAQAVYVLLYVAAVLVNLLFDIGIVVFTAYTMMKIKGVRTEVGVLMSDLPDSGAVFESYPMAKVVGELLFWYNICCFSVPFICEGFFTIVLPYHIGVRLVRSREMSQRNADNCLAPLPMDFSRYGDVILNFILATLCFFTASGWILWTLLGLLGGHLFIYFYDHYRILRQVESFYYSSRGVDDVSRTLLVFPCGVLGAAVMFQARTFSTALASINLWALLIGTIIVHCVFHVVFLHKLFGAFEHLQGKKTENPLSYKEVAKQSPANWFNVNPVHCLRSQYLHQHEPCCMFYEKGRVYLQKPNETLGLYFDPTKLSCPKLLGSQA